MLAHGACPHVAAGLTNAFEHRVRGHRAVASCRSPNGAARRCCSSTPPRVCGFTPAVRRACRRCGSAMRPGAWSSSACRRTTSASRPGAQGRERNSRLLQGRVRRHLPAHHQAVWSRARRPIPSISGRARRSAPAMPPRWNFHKYLVGRDGKLVCRLRLERGAAVARADQGDRGGAGKPISRAGVDAALPGQYGPRP